MALARRPQYTVKSDTTEEDNATSLDTIALLVILTVAVVLMATIGHLG